MNTVFASVLNKTLGGFVENLDPKQLNLSMFSGKIKLERLKVKPQFIDDMNFPFQLVTGYCGKIYIEIPWLSLGSSPLNVEVSDVFLQIKPKSSDKWDAALVRRQIESSKQSSLRNFEFLHTEQEATSQSSGWMGNFVRKIIDNVQITVNNVYIRYEDDISSIKPFAIGMVLQTLIIQTCNEEWKVQYVSNQSLVRKIISIANLSLFLDYENPIFVNQNEFIS